jgi:gamma-glutamyltranspeptidase/glutathione hydrolase
MDTHRFVCDPEHVPVPVRGLLSTAYADERRALIGDEAMLPEHGYPPHSDTVYLCTADSDGMMVSFIQSAYKGFGSRVVAPGLGFSFQNRGRGFSLDPNHPNALAPGKRPFHTIIPGFLTKDGEAIGPFGVMGGYMQPQGHALMIVNTLDHAMDPQTSIDQLRWQWSDGRRVMLEAQMDEKIVEGLRARGHDVVVMDDLSSFGRAQIIWRLPDGTYIGGSESRTDGQASGY